MCVPLLTGRVPNLNVDKREAPETPEFFVELAFIEVRLFGGS
jgi:hypothetical protein